MAKTEDDVYLWTWRALKKQVDSQKFIHVLLTPVLAARQIIGIFEVTVISLIVTRSLDSPTGTSLS